MKIGIVKKILFDGFIPQNSWVILGNPCARLEVLSQDTLCNRQAIKDN